MEIFINGEPKEIENGLNLRELLGRFDLPHERVAVELNKQVVRRRDWETIEIRDADKIEIVHFVGGG